MKITSLGHKGLSSIQNVMHCACVYYYELLILRSYQRPKLIIEPDVSVHFLHASCLSGSHEFCTYHILETTEVNTVEL